MKIERRFTLAEDREEEAFLAEQHAGGFRLTGKKGYVYTFEETAPAQAEYLIELPDPGTDPAAWRAQRQHQGFHYLFASGGVHYLWRPRPAEPFVKQDESIREAIVREALIRGVLRAFFFAVLAFVILFSPFPPEAVWLKFLLALISVAGLLVFALRGVGAYQTVTRMEKRKR